MLSIQTDDKLIIEDPSFFEQEKLLEDLLAADPAALEVNNVASKGIKKRPRKRSSAGGIAGNPDQGTDERKKIVHRDTERQRRQEMAGLHSLLRSHLPHEYIKGRRSKSDQMHGAANYIKHMQKNIKELEMRRDKLKKLSPLSGTNTIFGHSEDGVSEISHQPSCVTVSTCRDGVEILITDRNEKDFPMSRVLAELLGRGLNVARYNSAREHEQFLYGIQIEASDISGIDLPELHDRLTNIINPS